MSLRVSTSGFKQHKMLNGIRNLSVVLNFVVIISNISAMQSNIVICPSSFCVCDTWLALQRISCVGRHLYSIHIGMPSSNIQALDLSNNSISVLNNRELMVSVAQINLWFMWNYVRNWEGLYPMYNCNVITTIVYLLYTM